ncbi:ribosome silencing factor [Limisalsivibrio acetivorans]|uniref:ribosome silencing factor n=1 Tax=Limisalsivibrio acetivorans TaxID=1304888 RepID=UPI0003B53D63|nr:ribosome silencing factor [Limisalsivibrio acetivorans]
MTAEDILNQSVNLLDSRKAENISVYNISKVSSLADYLVIATASSTTHANSLSDYLLEEMKKEGEKPFAMDGYKSSRWVCLDFGNVIVNIMCQKERDYYDLEAIWGGSTRIPAESLLENAQTGNN